MLNNKLCLDIIVGKSCENCASPKCINGNCLESSLCYDDSKKDCHEDECLNLQLGINADKLEDGVNDEMLCQVNFWVWFFNSSHCIENNILVPIWINDKECFEKISKTNISTSCRWSSSELLGQYTIKLFKTETEQLMNATLKNIENYSMIVEFKIALM